MYVNRRLKIVISIRPVVFKRMETFFETLKKQGLVKRRARIAPVF